MQPMQPMQLPLEVFDTPQSFVCTILAHSDQSPCADNAALDDAELVADSIAAKTFPIIPLVEGAESILERIVFIRSVRLSWCDRRLVHCLQRGNVCYHVLQCFRRASFLSLW